MRATLLAAISAMAFGSAASAATLVNGSFETGSAPGSFTTLNSGSAALSGWTVDSGSIDYIGSYWQASDGTRSLDMSGSGPGKISQLITDLIVDRVYRVLFDIAGNPDAGNRIKSLLVASVEDGTYEFDLDDEGATRSSMKWQTVAFYFTALGTSQTLSFESLEPNAYGPALDNVRVDLAPVPVPATGALMLLALGGLGLARRRRG